MDQAVYLSPKQGLPALTSIDFLVRPRRGRVEEGNQGITRLPGRVPLKPRQWLRPIPFSRVGFFTGQLLEGVHELSCDEFPCA